MAQAKKQTKHNLIRIRLKAYDSRTLDKAVADIIDTARRSGTQIAGPIPLPTKCERFTVLRSPNIDRKSREQFEMRTHLRMIDLIDTSKDGIDALQKLQFPAGVEIQIKA
jgi:small subunit ribosomal protein S10